MKCFFILLIVPGIISSQIDNELNFYQEIANANYNKNFVLDYGADNSFDTDDSLLLQAAIDDIHLNGGGVLTIPKGNYSISEVNLKTNVHIKINTNVIIRPSIRNNQRNYSIFNLGKRGLPIDNVSITSTSENKFKIDLTKNNNPNVFVFSCVMVNNFMISDFKVDDIDTIFSTLSTDGKFFNGDYLFPKNGVVKNIIVNNANYGYGVVQTQSAENILFKNLKGTGGTTLRFETGFKGLNNLQGDNLPIGETRVGGINKMVARNITSINGNSAVMVSPHAVHNGTIDVKGVRSISSGFAVRIEGGFVSSFYDQTINLDNGTFELVRIKDVNATYGDNAQLKAKHIKPYMPDELRPLFPNQLDFNVIYKGPSIAGLLLDGNYLCNEQEQTVFIEEPLVVSDFEYQPTKVVPSKNETINCGDSLSINELDQKTLHVYPNPTSKEINISNIVSSIDEIEIITMSGVTVRSLTFKYQHQQHNVNIDVSGLNSGMYYLKIFDNQRVNVFRKIIIR